MLTIELPQVLLVREAFGGKATPRKASTAVALLSVLMEHGRALGWRKDNPALRPKRLKQGPGYPTWTTPEFAQFMASSAVPEAMKRAAALAFYTGARVSDLARLPRAARRDGAIVFTPATTAGTTRAVAHVAEHPALTAILDAAPASGHSAPVARNGGALPTRNQPAKDGGDCHRPVARSHRRECNRVCNRGTGSPAWYAVTY